MTTPIKPADKQVQLAPLTLGEIALLFSMCNNDNTLVPMRGATEAGNLYAKVKAAREEIAGTQAE